MAMTGTIPQDFKDFLKLLNSHGVKYLLIGGYAVGYYGYPRATADMDIWIDSDDKENLDKLNNVLNDFGIEFNPETRKLFAEEGQMVRIGFPPLRLEILSKISGVEFSECIKHKKDVIIGGIKVSIISKEDLIQNKIASGRYKDLDDIEKLRD